ncbi:chromate transporter [Butyrivibrio sp. MC2013]|uniref:chromate transporter n=1 Tax=Butyrivibrio sp. MC2013 TaxID=1280686 RepID=UPI00042413D8|nr:chromate transporter [Butyrivibrio sp. MC2013]
MNNKDIDNKNRIKILPSLFATVFALSASTFGGGFVIVSLLKKKAVEKYHWLEEDEMLDITALAQSAPGSIQVNTSLLLGYRLAGIPGAVTAIVAAILPPLILLSVIACFYDLFHNNPAISMMLTVMRAGVAAVIFDVVIGLTGRLIRSRSPLHISLMLISLALLLVVRVKAVYIIILCLIAGTIYAVVKERRK